MSSLPKIQIPLKDLYPEVGSFRINTCGNPDCRNFGRLPDFEREVFLGRDAIEQKASAAIHDPKIATGEGAYKSSGASIAKKHRRVSSTFEYADHPHEWSDERKVRCQAVLPSGRICNSGFTLLSERHLEEEVARLRRYNGVLDGPSCGCCGKRYLEAPDEFAPDGVHTRSKDGKGRPIPHNGVPPAQRVIHRPCSGKKGARITIPLPHAKQKKGSDNLEILEALLNSAGINDVQRLVNSSAAGRECGVSRIYDRIAWLEQVFLAYEQEMLGRWRKRVEASGKAVRHRLSHDDLALSVNWATTSDRRTTVLNCSVTADADSGYVYRIDADFDPRTKPLEMFRQAYIAGDGDGSNAGCATDTEPPGENRDDAGLTNLRSEYVTPDGEIFTAPRFSWQRPTGRLCQSAANRDPGSAFKRDPSDGELRGA